MSKQYSFSYVFKRAVLAAGLVAIAGGLYYKTMQTSPVVCVVEGVYDYDGAKDRQNIIDMFHADRYWMTVNDDYDIGYALDTHSPNPYETKYFGKMPLKVVREDGQVIGWTGYFMINPYEGRILFLEVHPDHRKKGVGRRLTQFAECDLQRMGARKVTLYTRTSNKAAHNAYLRMGYKRTNVSSNNFGFYEKPLR